MQTAGASLDRTTDTGAPSCSSETLAPDQGSIATLSIDDLCSAIQELAETERRTEWQLCRHLAELADRFDDGDAALSGHADFYQLARLRFGMSARRVRERVRVGRALRGLPRIEQAFVDGSLGYGKVREVTRVADAGTDAQWLAAAHELPQRVLERRVAEASDDGGGDAKGEPAAVRWTGAKSVELRLMLPAATWALLERAMEGARQKSEASLSDAEALEAIARDALAHQADGESRADIRSMVVLYECRSCARTEVETGAGPIEIDAAASATLACGAKSCDLQNEGRTVSHGGPVPAAVRRAVMLRDRMRCRVPGCTGRQYVDLHHLTARVDGGEHSRRNCLVLCGRCHARVHDGRLRIEGDAEGEIQVHDASGQRIGQPVTRTGHGQPVTRTGHAADTDLSPTALTLLELMATGNGSHPDFLCARSGLSASDVSIALMELLLARRVQSGHRGYQRI